MLKRKLLLIGLAIFLIAIIVPISIALADDGSTNKITDLDSVKENTPFTFYTNDKGEITSIEYGLPKGFKIEDAKELIDIKSPGIHNRTYTLTPSNRIWTDASHTAHLLDSGDKFYTANSWNPNYDKNNPNENCFIGILNVNTGMGIGLTKQISPCNLTIIVGSSAYYRPYTWHHGAGTVNFTTSYYPDYPY